MISQISFVLYLCISTVVAIDVQKQLEQQNTLNYILSLSRNQSLGQYNKQHHKKCVSLDCCICEQSFKTMKDSAIHSTLHHQQLLTYHPDIAVIFDEDIPSTERETFCNLYLTNSLSNTTQQTIQEVCTLISWNMHREQPWIQITKYILYIFIGLSAAIYYSEILKPWK